MIAFQTTDINSVDNVTDAMQGHVGSRGEADRYRHVSVAVMLEAIERIVVPDV
jgi:hypothetical protein